MTCANRHGQAGQALLELAIFGAVALAALGFLIRIGLEMNYDQEIRMAAFRRALAAASSDNGTDRDAMGTVFHYIADRRMPNPTDGFMSMPRSRTEASAFVEWGDRLSFATELQGNSDLGYNTQALMAVRSDGSELTYRQADVPDDASFSGGDVDMRLLAFSGIETQSTTTNNESGTITQGGGGSSVSSCTSTSSNTTLNANVGSIGGGVSACAAGL